jgi:serine protease
MLLRLLISSLFLGFLSLQTFATGGPAPGSDPQSSSSKFDKIEQLNKLSPDLEYEPGVIIVKFIASTKHMLYLNTVAIDALNPLLAEHGVTRLTQMYPQRQTVFSKSGSEIALDRMYRVEFSASKNPLEVAKSFARLAEVEYAEPEVIHYLDYIPDDSRYNEQYMHQLIESEKAWDITTGSEDIVIGIVDSGVNWNHVDLADNIWVNPGEDFDQDGKYTTADMNGIDDDNNGYIDDIIGIDFIGAGAGGGSYYDVDPHPTVKGNPHGTHVAGISAGVGDNGRGIAGVAFTSKILSVKCGSDINSRTISRGYDGIVYAAENGAQVINCSWGGGGILASQEERIEYAISQGALVVASAGNSGRELISTPGAYPNVLCVANTDEDDLVNSSSTYGPWVDVSAPGTQILSSISTTDSAYAKYTGTSMASPVVAGLAALVAGQNPGFTPLQIGEQIRVTSEDIDDKNIWYRDKIGKGRVNAHKALTTSSAAIRLLEWSFTDENVGNDNGILDQGESFTVSMTWQNLLAPANDVYITLSSPSDLVTIENPLFHAGAMNTMEAKSNKSAPFLIHIDDLYAPNDKIDLIFTIVDGQYEDEGGVYVLQQPTYRDHDVNRIQVTLTNDGSIGYDDFNGMYGSGLIYDNNGHDVVFEGAFMIAARLFGTPVVLDVARNDQYRTQSADFIGETLFNMDTPGDLAAQQGYGVWTDAGTPLERRLFLNISLDSYEFTEPMYDNFVILKYTIRNEYDEDYEDFHAGLFFDWDISPNSYSDFAAYDSTTKTAYAFDSSGVVPTHVGMAALTYESLTNHWALLNGAQDDSVTIGIYNGFTKEEKWRALTSGIVNPAMGISDITQILSNGPYTLKAEDSLIIAFVVMAGDTKEQILNTTPIARAKWDSLRSLWPTSTNDPATLPRSMEVSNIYPQPLSMSGSRELRITADLVTSTMVHVTLVDMLGRTRATLADELWMSGQNFKSFVLPVLPPGQYMLQLRSSSGIVAKPLIITE